MSIVIVLGAFFVMVTILPGEARAAPFRSLRLGVTGLKAATVNPNTITLTLEFIVVYNIYSTLATYDSHYQLIPDLAYKWEVAPDNVTWTFHLAQGAYFTDPANPTDRSHPVTADDVVFSYNLVMTNTSSILHTYGTQIASVTKLDTYTVQIVTKAPFAAMSSTLSSVVIFPQYVWNWQALGDPVKNDPTNPVGSGPMYMNTNTVLSRGPIILDRSPNYFGDAAYCRISRPDEVRIVYFLKSGGMVDSFKSGADGLDGIFAVESSSYLNGLPASGTLVPPSGPGVYLKWAVPSGFTGEIGLNQATPALRLQFPQFTGTSNPLLLNFTVRKAVAMSIDNDAIVKYAYLGLATAGGSLIPAVNPWHLDIPASEKYPFDPAAARTMLNAAGWAFDSAGNPATATTTPLYKAGGADPLIFRLYAPDSHAEFAVGVANMTIWLGKAGIQTTDSHGNTVPGYEVIAVNKMNVIWKTADWDLWLWDWDFATLAEPSQDIMEVETTMAIPSDGDIWYSNTSYDRLYNESLVTVDPVARRGMLDKMQQLLYDNASVIIPYYADKLYAATNSTSLGYGWEGWGDLRTTPGSAPDSDLPNLWFQLYPHDNPPPSILQFSSVDYVSGAPVSINVIASDPDNEPMNFTWDFGDGTAPQTTLSSSVQHSYVQAGNYSIKVRVKDSEWPACAVTTAHITAGGSGNLPPQALLDYRPPVTTGGIGHAWVNESVTFNVTVSDPEGDALNITWNFGDTKTATSNVTNTATPKLVSQSHTYTAAGNYTLSVVVTDGKTGAGNHTQTKTVNVQVWAKSTGGGGGGGGTTTPSGNPWINYGIPLGILAAIVLGVAAVFLRRRKTTKEEEREEGAVEPPKPPQPPPP